MNTFFNLIQPIANLPIFLLLNLSICLIAVHWYWMKSTDNFNDKLHRNMQRLGLFISILIIGILFVKQWNIGDLLAFYSVFSSVILIVALINNKTEIIKESRGWFINIFLVFFLRGYVYEPWQIPSESMRPNLEIGDFVLVNRNAYGLEIPFTGREKLFSKGPEVGEIVVFFPQVFAASWHICLSQHTTYSRLWSLKRALDPTIVVTLFSGVKSNPRLLSPLPIQKTLFIYFFYLSVHLHLISRVIKF